MALLQVGFVGAGRMAAHHAKRLFALAGQARLAAVADIEFQTAKSLGAAYNGRSYLDYREMIECESLDALFILTPPTVRLEPIQMACDRTITGRCRRRSSRQRNKAQS